MTHTTTDTAVTNNAPDRRYEIRSGEKVLGFAEYNLVGKAAVMFTHTEIDPAEEGHGYGKMLARAALDDVRGLGKQVIPMCHFIAGYIRKHPEYLDIVRSDVRAALRL